MKFIRLNLLNIRSKINGINLTSANIYMFKVYKKTVEKVWNTFKVNNKGTRAGTVTPLTPFFKRFLGQGQESYYWWMLIFGKNIFLLMKNCIFYWFSKLTDRKMQRFSPFFVLADFYSNENIMQLSCNWRNELLLGRNEQNYYWF